ncbi:hypothetical protein KUTeg_013347 [Tegillarca granosa]|uniref:Calponin-homology (CH) domain-containing protein n=1 Tax=Tegillarca granosa TaxID=220873 RepID=A0ABQ9EYV4_TEGGR|nr:hypothetical protein KUTeg_013347 [Tegillarca granosa]
MLQVLIGNVRVESVNSEITCKSDRVENLDKCLDKLKSVGVDTAGIDAEDLADGNLKSTLLLVGNIRQHFDKSTTSSGNEGSHRNQAESDQHLTRDINMPGAITVPGGSSRDSHFVNKDGVGTSYTARRIPYSAEDILPGTLGISKDDKMSTVKTSAPVGSLVSMTELSTNGVSQYGVEERRQQITLPTSRGQHLVRTQNMRPAVPSPKPPVTTTNAWSNEKPMSQNIHRATPSIEERLKSLINSPPSSAVDDEPPVKPQYTDGELLHVPRPQSRNGPEIDHRIPNNSVPYSSKQGPSFIGQSPQHGSHGNVYVPSKPTDRWQGSRAEAILDRSYDKTAYRYVPGGHDNQGFDNNDMENRDRINQPLNSTGDSELRNAWNRLYGKGTHPEQSRDQPVRFPSDPKYLEIKTNLADRASPMGQSSNNQSQDSSSNFHNTSWIAQDSSGSLSPPIHAADDKSASQNTLTLGPAAMYPDFGNRPSSARGKPVPPPKPNGEKPGEITQQNSAKQTVHVDIHKNGPYAINFNHSVDNQFGLRTNNKAAFNTSSDSARLLKRGLYDLDIDRGHHSQLDLQDSIFDYHGSGSEASSRSVTPPLPPLSPSNSESEESAPSVNYKLNRSASASMLTTPKTPDLVKSTTKISAEDRKQKNVNSGSQYPNKMEKKYSSGGKTNSKLLSNGYFMKGLERERNPSRRRWSICSSDTSSLRRPNRKVKPSPQNHQRHHYHHRDIK